MAKIKIDDFRDRPSLTHLKRLTTKDGLLQHSDLEVPDPSFGYSIDDNARALIVCLWHYKIFQDESVLSLADIYYSYIKKVEKREGSFHNFLSFTEKILDSEGSEDSIGRALWAIGITVRNHPVKTYSIEAQEIFKRANITKHLEHPHVRAKSFILLGLTECGDDYDVRQWSQTIKGIYQNNSDDDWRWFEDSVRYDNGILPYALARSYIRIKDLSILTIAKESFDWLDGVSRHHHRPSPIGQKQWYYRGQQPSHFDQQPLDAAAMVLAATALYEATHEKAYINSALEWMSWYHGNNIKGKSLINKQTGGIYDALTQHGVNKNQGAESIVTYLMAYLSLSKIANEST